MDTDTLDYEPREADTCWVERQYLNHPTPRSKPMTSICSFRDRFNSAQSQEEKYRVLFDFSVFSGMWCNLDDKERDSFIVEKANLRNTQGPVSTS